MRTLLDRLYLGAGALAAAFLVAIGVLVLLSIVSRMAGIYVPGLSAYSGYCMAASSYLALAYTFQRGGHIRVRVVLGALGGGALRRGAELWCLAVGAGVASYLAFYTVKMVLVSHQLGDVSEGADATPLWIAQIPVAVGACILAVSVVDRFVVVLAGGEIEDRTALTPE